MKNRPTNPILRAFDSLLEGNAGSWLITLFVIPLLVLFALVLPPLALPQRILSAGYSGISSTGGSVSAEGAQFAVPAGATKARREHQAIGSAVKVVLGKLNGKATARQCGS